MEMTFKHSFHIRWVDTDTAQVMHYSNYFRYFEACEEEFYRSLGLDFKKIFEKYGIGLPRVEAHCIYKAPSKYGDEVEVELTAEEIAEKTIKYAFQVFLAEGHKLAADGYLKIIAVNHEWKAVQIPSEFAKVIRMTGT
jgi:acyl-CoA thioester hydrolase